MQQLTAKEIIRKFLAFQLHCNGLDPNNIIPADREFTFSEEQFANLPHLRVSVENLLAAVFFFIKHERYEELVKTTRRALGYLPNHLDIRFCLALGYFFIGEESHALSIAREIDFSSDENRKYYERDPAAKICECPSCSTKGLYTELLTDPSIKATLANDAHQLFHAIHHYKQSGNYEQVIACYEEFFTRIAELPCLMVDLGLLYQQRKNRNEAKRLYARAIILNPMLYNAHMYLATIHYRLGEYKLAVAVLNNAKKYFPEDDMVLLELAEAYFKLGHLTKAAISLGKALAINPSVEDFIEGDSDMEFLLNIIHEKKSTMSNS